MRENVWMDGRAAVLASLPSCESRDFVVNNIPSHVIFVQRQENSLEAPCSTFFMFFHNYFESLAKLNHESASFENKTFSVGTWKQNQKPQRNV